MPGKQRRTANDMGPTEYVAISKPPVTIRRGARIRTAEDVYRYLTDLRSAQQEHLVAIDLDVRYHVIQRRIVHVGTLTTVECHPREVFRQAIVNSAAAIIVAHNHPSGDPLPSRQDVELTTRLRQVAELVGIHMLDHVVVAAEGFVSIAERFWT